MKLKSRYFLPGIQPLPGILLMLCFLILIVPGRVAAQNEDLSLGSHYMDNALQEKNLPAAAQDFTGTFRGGIWWEDEGGKNYLIVSDLKHEKEMKCDLYVYQFAEKNGVVKLLWDIKDFSTPLCDVRMVPNSLQILDLDGDGLMETSFIYEFPCDGNDPTTVKMILHHKGEKLALRGIFDRMGDAMVEKNFGVEVSKYPLVFKNFMSREWDEYWAEEDWGYAKFMKFTEPGFRVMGREYLDASGGTLYELQDKDGVAAKADNKVEERIKYALELELMPDQKTLLISSLPDVAIYDTKTGAYEALVSFLEDTEAISTLCWSASRKKLAFVTLNSSYPLGSKLFVLDMEGNKMLSKNKYDIDVWRMAANVWVIAPVTFENENTIRYMSRGGEDGMEEVPKTFKLE